MSLTGNSDPMLYFSVLEVEGVAKIAQTFKSSRPGAIQRTNKKNVVVYDIYNDWVEGYITDIKIKLPPDNHKEWGKTWCIYLESGGTKGVLQLHYSSGFAQSFLKMLPNIDLSEKVKFTPKITVDENNKKRSFFFLNQDGNKVTWFFTKDNNHGLPPLEKKRVKGKDVWDDEEMMNFFENMVDTEIVPQIKEYTAVRNGYDHSPGENEEEADAPTTRPAFHGSRPNDDPADDLPF